MSKSDQFAIPANAPASVPNPKVSNRRIAGWGCGSVLALLLVMAIVVSVRYIQARNQPFDSQDVIQSLAGVPVYPGAALDEGLTRELRGGLANSEWMNASKFKAVAGLRTSASPDDVIPYYDSKMAFFGFTKTTLGGGSGVILGKNFIGGASYAIPGTKVIIQMNSEAGEDNQLVVYRFDADTRNILKQPGDTVTPEDIKKAKADAAKKKKQIENPK